MGTATLLHTIPITRAIRTRAVGACAAVSVLALAMAGFPPQHAAADPVFPPYESAEEPPELDRLIGHFHSLVPRTVFKEGRVDEAAVIFQVGGVGGVPAEAGSVLVSVTGKSARKTSVLVWQPGTPQPSQAALSLPSGGSASNTVTVRLDDTGKLAVATRSGKAIVRVAVIGWMERSNALGQALLDGALSFHAAGPTRVYDSRSSKNGSLGPRHAVNVRVAGRAGVPKDAQAVALTVTSWKPTRNTRVTVYRPGARPASSTLTASAGRSVSTTTVVPVKGGRVRVWNRSGLTDLVLAVTGWYGPASSDGSGLYASEDQQELLDTRLGRDRATNFEVAGGANALGALSAAVLQVTATSNAPGYLTLWGAGVRRPRGIPSVAVNKGQTVTTSVVVPIGDGGNVQLFNAAGRTRVRASLIGWITGHEDGISAKARPREAVVGSRRAELLAERQGAEARAVRVGGTKGDLREMKKFVLGNRLERARAPEHPNSDIRARISGGRALSASYPNFSLWSAGYLQSAPAAPIGRIYGFNNGQWTNSCTGTVISRGYVLTAAHCVGHAGYTFYPAQMGALNSSTPWFSTEAYISGAYNTAAGLAADYAIIVFRPESNSGRWIGDSTGSYKVLMNAPGGTKWSFGYPSEGNFSKYCKDSTCYPYNCYAPVGDYDLKAGDPTVSYAGWYSVGFGCYMTGGASGGPVFERVNGTYYVVSVNSYITNAAGTYGGPLCTRETGTCFTYARNMWGPYLNEYFDRFYAAVPG